MSTRKTLEMVGIVLAGMCGWLARFPSERTAETLVGAAACLAFLVGISWLTWKP